MKVVLAAVAVMSLALVLTACGGSGGGDTSNLKQIEQQRAGEYVVTLLSKTGQLKQGPNKFVLEFRKASDNQLTDVGNVQLNSLMPMPGMSPMSGGASATPSGTPGRYQVESDFQMVGTWNFTVKFGNGQQARFALKAQ
ncbi:MAG: FixH family protein [Pyrinomonadaceae bacterium]|nr:FixH family protein [Pyrinomonadaceae bacterium]